MNLIGENGVVMVERDGQRTPLTPPRIYHETMRWGEESDAALDLAWAILDLYCRERDHDRGLANQLHRRYAKLVVKMLPRRWRLSLQEVEDWVLSMRGHVTDWGLFWHTGYEERPR